jgi:hypothetical protein
MTAGKQPVLLCCSLSRANPTNKNTNATTMATMATFPVASRATAVLVLVWILVTLLAGQVNNHPWGRGNAAVVVGGAQDNDHNDSLEKTLTFHESVPNEETVRRRRHLQRDLAVVQQSTAPANSLRDDLNFCARSAVRVPKGKYFDVMFQCDGPLYNNYTDILMNYADNTTEFGTTWGRRKSSLPPKSKTLIVGDMDMRQLAQVLACQEPSFIWTYASLDKFAYKMEFNNLAEVTVAISSYAFFHPDWQSLLEEQLQATLDSFDTIVIGNMEMCTKPNALANAIQAAGFPGVDCFANSPPTMEEWINVTSREEDGGKSPALLYVSLPTTRHYKEQMVIRKNLQVYRKAGDKRLGFINGRRYAKEAPLGDPVCMAPTRYDSGDCIDTVRTGIPCVGARGGLPDLVAWDVAEFLWSRTA